MNKKDAKKESGAIEVNLTELTQENGELKIANANLVADLQRSRADFENYRKRIESDLEFARRSGEQKFAKKVLPLIDSFEAVFANLTDEIRTTDLGKGLSLTEKNFMKTLTEMKIEPLPVKTGDEFDHNKMEAVASEGDGNKVSAVMRTGYSYNGEILRPTMVKVA